MTPDQHTIKESFLEVTDDHQLYLHEWGNAKAERPIIFLHGGPRNGCDDKDKRKFDPTKQYVIFFDQRGAGKSLPTGSLDHNTTDDLVKDIEKIATHLGLKQFVLVGGSWGSTLALCYAIKHPERVAGMVIDGIFTGTKTETDWLHRGGWRDFYPDIWQEYLATVPETHHDNPGAYHTAQALSPDAEAAKQSTYAYIKTELALLKLDDRYQPENYETFEPGGGMIELHYLAHNCFLPDKHILTHASKLTMPIYIIQGRYDMVCPPRTAHELAQALPNSKLVWTINGHLRQHEAANIQRIFIDQATGAD